MTFFKKRLFNLSVKTPPGLMIFEVILNFANSWLTALLKDESPPLDVADKIISGEGSFVTVEVIVKILPHFYFS